MQAPERNQRLAGYAEPDSSYGGALIGLHRIDRARRTDHCIAASAQTISSGRSRIAHCFSKSPHRIQLLAVGAHRQASSSATVIIEMMLRTLGRKEAFFSVALSVGIALLAAGAIRLMLSAIGVFW